MVNIKKSRNHGQHKNNSHIQQINQITILQNNSLSYKSLCDKYGDDTK